MSECHRRDSFYSATSKRSTYVSAASSSYHSLVDENEKKEVHMYGPASRLPPLTHPVPDSWHVIEGISTIKSFIFFLLTVLSHVLLVF